MLQEIKINLIGVCPMLIHNCQLADPMNEFTRELKKVSSKRKKTDDDHIAMSYIEFMGSLYVDDNKRYIIPSDNIETALVDAAKKERMGKNARAAIFCMDNFIISKFDGPKDPEARFKDKRCFDRRMVRIQNNRVLRTRPKFTNWTATGSIMFDTTQLDYEAIERWLNIAGQQIGICDYRPKFGRFEVEFIDKKE